MAILLKRNKPVINSDTVRLVDQDGEQVGVISLNEAFNLADKAGLDLVAVAENAMPPVCRILDFGKLIYEQKQKKKKQKKQQSVQKTKEVRFHVNIDGHDYDYKIDHAKKFLAKGYKVKVSLFFRGREAAHKTQGFEIVKKAIEDLKESGKADKEPSLAGRIISTLVSPLKN